MRRKTRSIWQWVALIAFVLLVAPLGLAALLRTPAAREYIRQQAVAAIRSELGLVGLIADVDVEPRTLSVVARGIVLDHPEHGRFVEAELLRIRPSWWAMLRGKLDLHVITIDRASVWLTLQDGALINGPRVEPSQSGGTSVDLPFNKLWVKHSRLVVRASPSTAGGTSPFPSGGHAELNDIDVFLDSTSNDVLGVQLHTPGGFVEHDHGRELVRELTARFKLTKDNVQVELLRLQSQELALNVERADVELPWRGSYHGEVDLRFALQRLGTWPLPLKLPALAGDLHVHAELVGDSDGLRGEAKLELANGRIDDYGLGEFVAFDVDLEPRQVGFKGQVEQFRKAGKVELVGTLRLEDKLPFSVRARVVDIAFDRLMEQLSVSPNAIVGWTLAGNFELKGTLDPLLLNGPLRMPTRDFRVTRDAWHVTPQRNVIAVASANLVGSVKVDPSGITLHDIDIGMRHSKLSVSEVLLGFDNQLRVRATGLSLDLADVTPLMDFPISGKGGFDVRVDGTFRQPSMSGTLHFGDFAFGTFPFGDIQSQFVLEKEFLQVRFPDLVGKKGASRFRARDFTLDFSDKRLAINAALSLDRFAMQDFYHVFHYEQDERYLPYQALVDGRAQLRYTLGYPGDSARGTLQADMDLELHDAELDGFAFQSGEFNGRFSWFDHAQGYRTVELAVDRFALHKAETTINISGKMAREGKLDMVVVADRVSVRDTEGLAERVPELSGEYNATGTIKGELAMPRADLELASVGLTYKGEPTGSAHAYVRLTGKDDPWVKSALDWPEHEPPSDAPCGHAREGLARGVWPDDPPLRTAEGYVPAHEAPMAYLICGEAYGGKLAIDMAVGRTRSYPVRGQLEFRGLEFGKLLSPGRKDAPRAKLSGLLQLHGGVMLTPSSLSGRLALDAVEIGQLGVTLQNQGPIRASFSRGQFELESATLTGPSASTLTVSGGASLQSGLAFELAGAIDLGILPGFVPVLQSASGRVSADIKITGQLDRPSIFGQTRLVNGGIQLRGMPFPIEKVDALATISAQRLLLEQFSANLLGGNVRMQGVATLDGSSLGGLRLEVQGQRVAFTPRDGVDLVVGGQGALSWKKGDRLPKLTGSLRLDRATYRRPITVGRTLRDMTKAERTDVDSYDPSADTLELDLRVVQAEPLRIENNLIDAEISIDDSKDAFRLIGTDQRFGVLGRMSIRRGTVRLRDTAFDIEQGEITFDNAHRVEPSFDVHAETDVRRGAEFGQANWHIGAHAWGSPESFQFTLLSDPYLSQEDISLLLAVGMTQTELAALRTSDVTGTAALEALATVTGVDSEVKRALPAIDEVRIGSAYSQRSERTEPHLHLGKRIADRVRLDAATGLSETRDFSTSLEYQISDETSVGAAYNNQTLNKEQPVGDIGVDLKWRLEFD